MIVPMLQRIQADIARIQADVVELKAELAGTKGSLNARIDTRYERELGELRARDARLEQRVDEPKPL